MNTITTSDPSAMAIFRRAFPSTNFRSINVEAFRGPMSLNSYWDSGYRDFFAVVRISDGELLTKVAQNGTPYDGKNYELSALPDGYAVAVHHYAGQRQTGSLYLNAANITAMLPAPTADLTFEEKAVLLVTSGLKSFARRDEAACMGVKSEAYETALSGLKAKRLLNSAGAITIEGRNLARTLHAGITCDYRTFAESNGRSYRRAWETSATVHVCE